MREAVITVGMGYGDEGKGATVDYLVRSMGSKLVVRYSGGSQCGHTVVLPNGGRYHGFSQFGSGTLAGAMTYIGPEVVISPDFLGAEAEHLKTEMGIPDPFSTLVVHPDCLVSTVYHRAANRLRELNRGDNRHGSCGHGIGEARAYFKSWVCDAIFARDFSPICLDVLEHKLWRLMEALYIDTAPLLEPRTSEAQHVWGLESERLRSSPHAEALHLIKSMRNVTISSDLPAADTVIFEGAQGILLDETYGFHPHRTRSTVTPKHALEIVAQYPDCKTSVLGVTRTYLTRHGAGPLRSRTLCDGGGRKWPHRFLADNNPDNDWQGHIQYGALDLAMLEYAADCCGQLDALAVTWLDECTGSSTVRLWDGHPVWSAGHEWGFASWSQLANELEKIAPIWFISNGPTWSHRSEHRNIRR